MATNVKQHPERHDDNDHGCKDCDEKDNATQKSINVLRREYCNKLYEAAGEVRKAEKTYEGEFKLYGRKKCMFLWTEENYRRYRNTEICIGTELNQSNDLIKENVGNYVKWGNELSASLKSIFKSVKDVKAKMKDLRDAACRLEDCMNDNCNCTQMIILTGKAPEGCKDDTKQEGPKEPKNECKEAGQYLKDIVCMAKALVFDINSIFKSSSEIIGIQVFSNIGTLEPLQKTFSDRAKEIDKLLLDTMKARESDLKKIQEELIKSVQETTKASSVRYGKRSDFEGSLRTVDYICCPDCDCVADTDNVCEPRLKDCECKICDICEDVQKTFCSDGCEEPEKEEKAEAH
jgi:hypothetical protein